MLILERRVHESIHIGADIRITLVEIHSRTRARLGLEVPAGVPIWRSEIDPHGEGAPPGEGPSRAGAGPQGGAESPATAEVHGYGAGAPLVENTLRILMVEDDPLHAKLVSRALDQAGAVETLVVHDGESALAYLRQHAGDPDTRPHLVLQDLSLPGISGLDVLREIKDPALRALPVVMLSCSDGDAEIQACLEAGANAFVTKAHDYEELRRSVARIASFWRHTQKAHH